MTNQQICSGLHMTAKPIGPRCNLACRYCFYSEKAALYGAETQWRMSPELLERFIKEYICAQPGPEVSFLWQGGEPMLMGLEFYEKAIGLQRKYAAGKRIHNAIQTNGTLIDDDWCRFFRKHGFLVGLSLDGPAEVHDAFRFTRSGRGSHELVVRGLELLQRYGVEFNVLCCVSRASAGRGREIYAWFKKRGVRYLQFAPVVERLPDEEEAALGLAHGRPAAGHWTMAPFSTEAEDYGHFLCDVFDEWVMGDAGRIFVMNFEWALERWMGLPAGYCFFAEQCGKALALEHNGDVYACDHFVYPEYRLGNLTDMSCAELLQTPVSREFRARKKNLSDRCKRCEYRFACNGECPKNRILPGGENYLCQGYRIYFAHIAPVMEELRDGLRQGKRAEEILRR